MKYSFLKNWANLPEEMTHNISKVVELYSNFHSPSEDNKEQLSQVYTSSGKLLVKLSSHSSVTWFPNCVRKNFLSIQHQGLFFSAMGEFPDKKIFNAVFKWNIELLQFH